MQCLTPLTTYFQFRFNTKELGYFVGLQIVEALLSPKPYERMGTSSQVPGARVRLPPPVSMSSLPVFTFPRTVTTKLMGGATLLHSSLPAWTGKLESQSLVTGNPGGEKLSVLKVG